MKRKTSDSGATFSFSIFRSFTLTIALTIMVLSGILHFYFEDLLLKRTYAYTLNNLAQTSQEASIMAVNARTFAKQIYNDLNVAKLLYFSTGDPVDISSALAQLNSYRATSLFIDSIYIYNYRSETFYISADVSANAVWKADEFYDTVALDMVKRVSDFETLMPIPRKIPLAGLMTNEQEKERDCYTFLLYDTLSRNREKNVIIVNISETQMHKNIDGMIVGSDKNTFIIDNRGVLITNSWKDAMLTDLSGKPYIRKVLDDSDAEGYFVSDVDGVKSLVTYTAPDFLGWRYIRIAPYNSITSGINKMRVVTIVVAVGILFAGLLSSYLISRRLSTKVNGKLVKLTALETERRDQILALRQDLIRNLLLGTGNANPDGLDEKFKAYGIRLDAGRPFAVSVLKIDRYKEIERMYGSGDRTLLKIGIINIAQELLAPVCPSTAADMGDDRIAILHNLPESASGAEAVLTENLWRQVQSAVANYIKLSVSIAVSGAGGDARSVNRLYGQAEEALFHRLFFGHGCLLYADRIEPLKAKPYVYPISKEKQLIEELMLGRIGEVCRLFRDIVEETAGYSYMSFHLAVSHLAFAVNSAVSVIRKNNDIAWELNINALLSGLADAETAEEVFRPFFEVFERVSASLEEKKQARHDETVGKIMAIVREKYMRQELSLDSIADELGLSAAYIGRLFKKHTMNTILNYIIEVRMEKARELLLATNLPVGDIAERTGFSNSPYFYKAFKKINGVTPADFRRNGRIQEGTARVIG
ncbi:helix-turn-helix domain-containing protein [Paenibacillus thermoaerophilus]|uniref:Helix-turn-helix domain-containing protein n=1 Tax=Paenibacillus thermoaerophilus TaxID=1215385 RepID=A0ABW2V032_9BACL|nr:helix-turn-helix domain-containing protein [Paenibacillus thermoaerophilus]TMV18231.1 helix-turn-helix domain-containing protein [Paenibacillus thermoaerophilus]